jgi:cytochrome c peroxidase
VIRFGHKLLAPSVTRRILAASISAASVLTIPPARSDDAFDRTAAAAVAGEVAHKQKMRQLFQDRAASAQATPEVIPQLDIHANPSGKVASYRQNGSTFTANTPFFQNLGSNGRTCFSCHQPQDGWSLSAAHAQDRFAQDPNDPLFRLVDGATCPSADVSTLDAKRAAYTLLLDKGLIRVGLPMQSTMEFQILDVTDPYGCNTNALTGLTGSKSGIASFYRRPQPSTNLGLLSTIMWDGREPDLFHQSVDATMGHAQGNVAPSSSQQQQIVAFEGCATANNTIACADIPPSGGLSTAQLFDSKAGYLDANGGQGGPVTLSQQLADFFIGINDPLGFNPTGAPFSPVIFTLFEEWSKLNGNGQAVAARRAIQRGEEVFNSIPINITGVGGLNDALNKQSIPGFCGTCHDTPNSGNHSVKAPLNIGVANAGAQAPPVLDISRLPVFRVWCTAGPLSGQIFEVTDIGRAMISGNCADIGKVKGPILRGLAARAPYFHDGSAATLDEVVEFYDQRFSIGMTARQKADLIAFLNAL